MERSLEIIFGLIEEKKYALVREELLENNEADIAENDNK